MSCDKEKCLGQENDQDHAEESVQVHKIINSNSVAVSQGLSEIELLRWENELLKRELALHNSDRVANSDTPSTSSSREQDSANPSRGHNFKMGMNEVSTLILEYNPSVNRDYSASNWVGGIETLRNVYGWDERSTLFYATLRLGGAAVFWYQSRQHAIQTWDQFKAELIESFPTAQDDSSILLKIMERKRRHEECIEDYVYQIAALAKKINLPEPSTVKYIISGLLDNNLINILMASNCQTISKLLVQVKSYEEIQNQGRKRGILVGNCGKEGSKVINSRFHPFKHPRETRFENRLPEKGPKGFKNHSETLQITNSRDAAIKQSSLKCFRCGEKGHYARMCALNGNLKKCFQCHQAGHVARECKVKKVSSLQQLTQNVYEAEDEYHKIVLIDGKPILAFLDLGSDCTTIKQYFLVKQGWNMETSDAVLKGFGGKQTKVLGKIKKTIQVSDVEVEIDIFVVNDNDQDSSMIIGKNFMDRPDIEILKRWGTFEIRLINKSSDVSEQNRPNNDKYVYMPLTEEDIQVGSETNKEEMDLLLNLINKYRKCFAKNVKELGLTDYVEMKIQLKEKKIINYHPYKVAYGLKSVLRKSIQDLLDLDIIQRSSSEYASPVLLVPKKNGEYRMVVDYRKLNAITQRETFPVPNIEETLNSLANKRIFTSLDLMSGYHQIPIDKNSRHLTAFITPEGHYEFKRVPFGLTNSPAVFMKLMTQVAENIGRGKVIIYMDDVLVATKDVLENIQVLEEFLKELKSAGLTLNVGKCVFFKRKLEFLGHEISAEGIKPGDAKVIAVKNYKTPENAHEVRQFLGLAGYFRRFVQGFANIAQPLNRLLRKDVGFEWTEETETSFKCLKEILCKRPLLALYDENTEHEVHTDASSHGIAGILMQRDGNNFKPVTYFSRATTPAETKYHSYELEALAVVESLERFKHYLLLKHFKIVTDCNSLRMTQEKKDLVPRIARWWLKISEYNFELVFRPGTQLAHADALSRCPVEEGNETENVTSKVLIVGISTEDWLAVLQKQDPRLKEIKQVLDGTIVNHVDRDGIKGNYVLEQNRIYKMTAEGKRFVVPNGIRWRVIKTAHDDVGHPGIERTLKTLKKYFWFNNMKPVVTKYVNSCLDCLYNKKGIDENRYHLHQPERLPVPFHTIHIDHLGPFPKSKSGHLHVIGMIDSFTKFIILKPTRTTTSRGVTKMLEEITQFFGMPTRIITDRGTAFTSGEFRKFCQQNVVIHILNAVKTPRGNGQIERYFRTTKTAIATMTQEPNGRDWDKHLPDIQWALNTFKHSTTRATPQELLMSYQPRNITKNKLILALHGLVGNEEEEEMPLSELRERVLQRINEKQLKQSTKFNDKHRPPRRYNEGDLVLIRHEVAASGESRKIHPRYKGPYMVKAVLTNDRYVIADTEEMQVTQKPYESVHAADRMKPWCQLDQLNFDDEEDGYEGNEDNEAEPMKIDQ